MSWGFPLDRMAPDKVEPLIIEFNAVHLCDINDRGDEISLRNCFINLRVKAEIRTYTIGYQNDIITLAGMPLNCGANLSPRFPRGFCLIIHTENFAIREQGLIMLAFCSTAAFPVNIQDNSHLKNTFALQIEA